MNDADRYRLEGRVLVLVPPEGDAARVGTIVCEASIDCDVCASVDMLRTELYRGAGAVLVAEEIKGAAEVIAEFLAGQPSWSDLPVLVLTSSSDPEAADALSTLGNVTFLDRPFRAAIVVSAVRAALRARARQYQMRERLEAKAFLAAIVESSHDAIISKTLDGMVISWNAGAERLFGFTAAEMIGKPITIIIPPERHHEEQMILERLRRGESIEHYETVRVRKDGRPIDISLTISPIHDGMNRIVGASKVARDITAQKQVEAALRDASRQKDEFLAMLAHELRNPLAPIRNGLYLLPRTRDNAAEFEATRRMMETQLQHMIHLLDDLLDISRIGRNKIHLRKQRIELAWVINDAVEATRPLIEERGHELSVRLPSEPICVEGDSVRLTQVVSNLLNNAAKYTEPDGRIWITAEVEADEAVIHVRDNGIGISEEMLPRVFDLFAQAGDHRTHVEGGLGIGLSLVKRLVEMHGGSVEAHSAGPGKGSEFVIRLPVLVDQTAEKEPVPEPAVGPPRRILVVDDNRSSADSMAMVLRTFGHEVAVAYDGPDALAMAADFHPDAALLDVGLPGMDGNQVARTLRGQTGAGRLTLIAMTGWSQEEDRRRSLAAGFDAHLVKPVKMSAVCELLAKLESPPPE
jgi:PAS domain S-box-containing protein